MKRSWPTWWILPYLGGAVVVLAVFAVLQVTVLNDSSKHGAATPASTVLMPAQMFPDTLFKQLTKDLQAKNEKGFLSLVAPSARPAVQTWWENLNAIGFTTGLVMPTDKANQVNLDSQGNGTTVALAGTHSPLDPIDNQKHPSVPLERYQLSLHFSSPKAIGQITAWKPLGDAPWDEGQLYVRKGTNVVVAGPASDSAVVDQTLQMAQDAATYDMGLINHVHSSDLSQNGFVVFVSNDPAARSRWFTGTKQPPDWPPTQSSGMTVQLPGPGASANANWSVGNISTGTTGGARVVITPFEAQNGGSAAVETQELVTRFALGILSVSNQALGSLFPAATPPAWAIEGFAVAFEAAYLSNTSPTPDSYSFKALTDSIKKLPTSYKNGDVPSASQLYNATDDTEQNARVAAASVYAYIATHYGMSQMLASAELMWTAQPDPRQNVLKSSTSTSYTMYGKDTIQAGWEAYLANPTDSAPATGPSGV